MEKDSLEAISKVLRLLESAVLKESNLDIQPTQNSVYEVEYEKGGYGRKIVLLMKKKDIKTIEEILSARIHKEISGNEKVNFKYTWIGTLNKLVKIK